MPLTADNHFLDFTDAHQLADSGAVLNFYRSFAAFYESELLVTDYTPLRRLLAYGMHEQYPPRFAVTLRPLFRLRDKSDRTL
jgi:hypothetical protein